MRPLRNIRCLAAAEALGFEPDDRALGFLYVGTQKEVRGEAARLPRQRWVHEWSAAGTTGWV